MWRITLRFANTFECLQCVRVSGMQHTVLLPVPAPAGLPDFSPILPANTTGLLADVPHASLYCLRFLRNLTGVSLPSLPLPAPSSTCWNPSARLKREISSWMKLSQLGKATLSATLCAPLGISFPGILIFCLTFPRRHKLLEERDSSLIHLCYTASCWTQRSKKERGEHLKQFPGLLASAQPA